MGYAGGGGTITGTINADIVTTDVQAIVDGITGPGGHTLNDLFAALDSINYRLYDVYNYRSVAEVLTNIESILNGIKGQTDRFIFDEYGRLIVTF